jgi:hypothetical protein
MADRTDDMGSAVSIIGNGCRYPFVYDLSVPENVMLKTSEPTYSQEHQQWYCVIMYRDAAYAASFSTSQDGALIAAQELIDILKAAGIPKT